MLGDLIDVANRLSELSDSLTQANNEKRQVIADYFNQIAKCLDDSAKQLEQGQVPNSNWGQLGVYARELPTTIGDVIDRSQAQELADKLQQTVSQTPTNNDISSIETAAGTFIGLANTVRVRRPSRRKLFVYTAIGTTVGILGGLAAGKLTDRSDSNPLSLTVPDEFPKIDWEMHTFLSDSFKKTILFNAPEQICDRIKKMTNDRFNITLKRTGETQKILEEVNKGSIPCGYSGIYNSNPQYRSLWFNCAIPFGLNPQEQNAWLSYKKNSNDKLTFAQSIYEKINLNIISFPAGATGTQTGGWFKSKINSLDDLKGKIIRIPGLGAEIWRKFGMTTHQELSKPPSLEEAVEKLKTERFLLLSVLDHTTIFN
jgi:hypothetical protein